MILETRMSAEYLKSGSNDARVTLCERKHYSSNNSALRQYAMNKIVA